MNFVFNRREQAGSPAKLGGDISVSCLNRDEIMALGCEWEHLCQNALENNAYYAPAFMRPALDYIDTDLEIRALAVRKRDILIGFLPFVNDKWRWLGAARVNKAWTNPYIASTIPVIDKNHSEEAMAALVQAMGLPQTNGRFWLFKNFTVDGPVGALLTAHLTSQNMSSALSGAYSRPVMTSGETFESHMETQVSRSRRRGLARNRKRLQKLGEVTMKTFTGGVDLDVAVEAFLRIEASGWKGEKGSALACDDNLARFARSAFGSKETMTAARADILYLDDKHIAVSLSAQSGRTIFTLKTAYDETYKAFGPGLLLEQDIVESFLTGGWAEVMDSAVTEPTHVLGSLWNSKVTVGTMLLCVDNSKTQETFSHYQSIEAMRQRLRKLLKEVATIARP